MWNGFVGKDPTKGSMLSTDSDVINNSILPSLASPIHITKTYITTQITMLQQELHQPNTSGLENRIVIITRGGGCEDWNRGVTSPVACRWICISCGCTAIQTRKRNVM